MNQRHIELTRQRNAAAVDVGPIPVSPGIGLKPQHYVEILETRPEIGWVEVHPENYFGAGGPPHRYLSAIRRNYPVSFHCVGLSLGSAESIDLAHLNRLKALIERYQPGLISEHLSWSASGEVYLNDLLPLPYTEESLRLFVRHVCEVQEHLGRRILVENPSTYLRFKHSTIEEPEFLAAIAAEADCGILLDVNNVFVSAQNNGFDPVAYIDQIPAQRVGEIHVAGHHLARRAGREILIDDHGSRVTGSVWHLLRHSLRRYGPVPVLVEWDTRIPELAVLVGEARRAARLLEVARAPDLSPDGSAVHAAAV